jgi:hypothetical protein
MYIIETEVSRESYADGYPGQQNPQKSDIPQTCFDTYLHLPLGLTRGHFSLWFPLMLCDHLSYYKGINI